ncbi:hypothetical protein [Paenibacillus sp. BC26]|uniref:hypothetical protein n=1 Tax=Paenibacillus sp. BC26 TaxID=1881032 RepID=UPI0008E9CAD6|nr:hypothetical protein [Paenibacillus sp. BC26]SFT27247.1 hypothetical protein SAMN05428962_6099 [Paenibacillus sp. BC26]
MNKKFITAAMTLGVATILVAGNGIISANASTNTDVQKVKVIGKHQQPDLATEIAGPGSKPGIINNDLPVNEKEAVEIAGKAIEEKFKVSLSGLKISYDLGTRVDMEGKYYFVTYENQQYTYTDAELIKAKRDLKAGKEIDIKWNDIYVVFVNAETGEVVTVMKNPTAAEGEF